MKETIHCKLLIIGSGIAAWTAAIYAARANLSPFVICDTETTSGTENSPEVSVWPGDLNDQNIQMKITAMRIQALNAGASTLVDQLVDARLLKPPFKLSSTKRVYICDSLIIANQKTSSDSSIYGMERFVGKGVSYNAINDGHLFKMKDVVVIGDDDYAIESARWLASMVRKVWLVSSNDASTAIEALKQKIIAGTVSIISGHIVSEILSQSESVSGVILRSKEDGSIKQLRVSACFLAQRANPDSTIFSNQLKMHDGYIKINGGQKHNATATSVPGVFYASGNYGPLTQLTVVSSRDGCMAALDAENFLREKSNITIME